jgi:hypothetical protein
LESGGTSNESGSTYLTSSFALIGVIFSKSAVVRLQGIIQNTRKAVGTFSGGVINHGFSKRYRYDKRLMFSSPPMYPGTGAFEIVSWLE